MQPSRDNSPPRGTTWIYDLSSSLSRLTARALFDLRAEGWSTSRRPGSSRPQLCEPGGPGDRRHVALIPVRFGLALIRTPEVRYDRAAVEVFAKRLKDAFNPLRPTPVELTTR